MFKKIFFVHKKRKYQFGSQNVLTPNIKKKTRSIIRYDSTPCLVFIVRKLKLRYSWKYDPNTIIKLFTLILLF